VAGLGLPRVLLHASCDTVGSDISAILSAARALRGNQPTRILVTNYWNVFADGDVASASEDLAYFLWSDELTAGAQQQNLRRRARRRRYLCRPVCTIQGDGP